MAAAALPVVTPNRVRGRTYRRKTILSSSLNAKRCPDAVVPRAECATALPCACAKDGELKAIATTNGAYIAELRENDLSNAHFGLRVPAMRTNSSGAQVMSAVNPCGARAS